MSHKWTPFVFLVFLSFLIYGNSLKGQFVWDDEGLIEQNELIKDARNLPEIFKRPLRSGNTIDSNYYRPLQSLSYMAEYAAWGLKPWNYHAANLLLHAGVGVALFFLLQLLKVSQTMALLGAALFLAHPTHTEAVAYISGRADPLAALFFILSFSFYLRYLEAGRVWRLFLMGFFFLLALLSKENVLIYPGLILAHGFMFKPDKRRFRLALGVAIVVASAYILARIFWIGHTLPPVGANLGFWERLPGFLAALAIYARVLVWPTELHMEYGHRAYGMTEPIVWAGVGVLLAVSAIFYSQKKAPLRRFGLAWFFVTLLPYSGVFPLNAVAAEHWLYLPAMGFFILLSDLVRFTQSAVGDEGDTPKKWWNADQVRFCAFIGLIIFYSALTIQQNRVWKDSLTLNRWLEKVAPTTRVYNNLGTAYFKIGDSDKALFYLEKAVGMAPGNFQARNNLGLLYQKAGDTAKARAQFDAVIRMVPNDPRAYYYIGTLYFNDRKVVAAADWFKKATAIGPRYADAWMGLARVYERLGDYPTAFTMKAKARDLNPDLSS